MQVQPDKILAWSGGGGQEIPSLVKEFLVINSSQEQLALIKGVAFDS